MWFLLQKGEKIVKWKTPFNPLIFQILRKKSFFRKVVTWTCILLTIIIVGLYKLIVSSNHPFAITKNYIYIEPLNSFFRQTRTSNETRDWNDYRWMKEERTRFGYGEHGLKTYRDTESPAVEEALMQENGHNALVSDKISLDRSVPDLRSVEWDFSFTTLNLYKNQILGARRSFIEENYRQCRL